jgi:flagellar motor switch/type III secretory pathway protein FliN
MMPWVPVRLTASCGHAERPVAAWRRLAVGDRVVLDQRADAPVPVLINGRPIGTAYVVTQDGHYALELVHWGDSV